MADQIIDVNYEVNEANSELEGKSTEQLCHEANGLYQQMEAVGNVALMMAASAGRRLLIVKERLPHGEFGSWCDDNLDFSQSKANKMMQLAKRATDENSIFSNSYTCTNLSISKVFALLSAPEEIAKEVIESEDVTDMTVTELKGEIAALKARNDELEAGTGDEIENLKNRIAELEAEQSESEISTAELEAKNQEIEKLTQKLEKEKARVASAKAKANEDVQKAVDKYKAEKEGKAELQAAYAEKTIARLEKELSASSQNELTTFRTQVNILQEIFQSCCKSLAVIEAKDPGQGEKVRSALLQVLHTEEEQLKELKFIADHYGLENQLGKCIEELNELVEALSHENIDHVQEEIADVENMIEQVKYLLGLHEYRIRCIRLSKTFRQLTRMVNHDPGLAVEIEALQGAKNKDSDNDSVNEPKHYRLDGLGIESIDVIKAVLREDGFKAFCRGNALKYLIRADHKGGVEDLEKARVYLNWEIGMEDRIAIVTDIKQTEWDGRNPNEG